MRRGPCRNSRPVPKPPSGARRLVGRGWLIGLALLLLALAVIGYVLLDRSGMPDRGAPQPGVAWPTLAQPPAPAAPPGLTLAPLSIVRHEDDITLDGSLPDDSAKRVLLDAVIAGMGDDIRVIDHLEVDPNIKALDFAAAGPVFDAAAAIPDFTLTVSGDTVTLAGTAATNDDADAVAAAAEEAWRRVNIVNKMQISTLVIPTAAPGAPNVGNG